MTPDYESLDALGLAELVTRGEVTPAELLDEALTRYEARNPELNAVVIPMLDEARASIERGLPDGPFRGVPFLLKDLALQYEGTLTTGGCRYFADAVADHDSEIVRRYAQAGLVIFGKSASPEFGLTTTTESVLHGPTRNPWNTQRTAGGSSGGAAAAVAAGILPLANASDGGGSIRIPAACCGLFGLKPSRGRMPFGPRLGEGWAGMSTAHAVSRSVRDSAALLDATCAPEVGAPYAAPHAERPFLDEVGRAPGSLRIAIQTRAFNGAPVHGDCIAAVQDVADLCRALGHAVEESQLEIDYASVGGATQTIISANMRNELRLREEVVGRPPGDGDLEPFTALMLAAGSAHTAADYVAAVQAVHASGRQVAEYFQRFDAILTPTLATPPMELGALSLSNPDLESLTRNMMATSGFTQIFNVSGSPAMSIPLCWNAEGLPIGVQLAADLGGEPRLIRLAAQLEEARPWYDRRPAMNLERVG